MYFVVNWYDDGLTSYLLPREYLKIWLDDHQTTKRYFIPRCTCLRLCRIYFVDTTFAISFVSSVQVRRTVRLPGTIIHAPVPGRHKYINSPAFSTPRIFKQLHKVSKSCCLLQYTCGRMRGEPSPLFANRGGGTPCVLPFSGFLLEQGTLVPSYKHKHNRWSKKWTSRQHTFTTISSH